MSFESEVMPLVLCYHRSGSQCWLGPFSQPWRGAFYEAAVTLPACTTQKHEIELEVVSLWYLFSKSCPIQPASLSLSDSRPKWLTGAVRDRWTHLLCAEEVMHLSSLVISFLLFSFHISLLLLSLLHLCKLLQCLPTSKPSAITYGAIYYRFNSFKTHNQVFWGAAITLHQN